MLIRLILITCLVAALGCDNEATFTNNQVLEENEGVDDPSMNASDDATASKPEDLAKTAAQSVPAYKFSLEPLIIEDDDLSGQAKKVFKNGPIAFQSKVLKLEGESYVEDASSGWKVTLSLGDQLLRNSISTGKTTLDLANERGMTEIKAVFSHTKGSKGYSQSFVFLDAEGPNVQFFELESKEQEDNKQVSVSGKLIIKDNYQASKSPPQLYACTFQEETINDQSCTEISENLKLENDSFSVTLDKQLTLPSGETLDFQDTTFYVVSQDGVGNQTTSKMIRLETQSAKYLTYSVNPSSEVIYTNKNELILENSLALSTGNTKTDIELTDEASDPGLFQIHIDRGLNTTDVQALYKTVKIPLGDQEKETTVKIFISSQVDDLKSNKLKKSIITDFTPPEVQIVSIKNSSTFLNKDSRIQVQWLSNDNHSIAKHRILIKLKGSEDYTPLDSNVASSSRTHSFAWGERPAKGFFIMLEAEDLAGNLTKSTPKYYAPQIFNAAVLTTEVKCFYCHLSVEGDVGGVNLSTDISGSSGRMFKISGTLFADGPVDEKLKTSTPNIVENYKNDGVKIFPKDVNADSVPDFEVLTATDLKKRVNGIVKLGSIYINRIYEGNLVLDGTAVGKPIELSGEVFINGDLIIKGTYKGVGTIYANNIYVVDDIIATDSPFPYPLDPNEALQKAKLDIKDKKDGLYLGALNQLLVGDIDGASALAKDSRLNFPITTPYSWIEKSTFEKMGRQAEYLKKDGEIYKIDQSHIKNPTTDHRVNLEVNRVDAYLFSQKSIYWRSYGSILINGGFMGPAALLVSSTPHRIDHHHNDIIIQNPRTGLSHNSNVVRYDYRLRAGGGGFEALKVFFDQ